MNKVLIRKGELHDSPILVALLRNLYEELGEEKESLEFLTTILVEEILQSGNTEIWLAYHGTTVAGILTLTETQAIYAGGRYGVIDEMYVVPEYRSGGIGKQLIQKVHEIAKQKHWTRVDVTGPTEARWERTLKFYTQEGFVFTGSKLKWRY